MVVNPQRYGNDDMVELRLHQLSVTSNCRVPTEEAVEYSTPVKTTQQGKNDASTYGIHTVPDFTSSDQSFIDDIWSQVFESILMYVAGWWPILHIVLTISSIILGQNIKVDLGVDMLLCVSIYQLDLFSGIGDGTVLDGLPTIGIAILESSFLFVLPTILAVLVAADAASLSIAGMTWALALYTIASLAIFGLMSTIFWWFTIRAWNGEISNGEAWALYFCLFVQLMIFVAGQEYLTDKVAGGIISWSSRKFGNTVTKGSAKALRTGKYFILLMVAFSMAMIFYHLIASL